MEISGAGQILEFNDKSQNTAVDNVQVIVNH